MEAQRKCQKIDVHHHIFPGHLTGTKLETNKKLGWRTPEENLPWSLSKSLKMMDEQGIAAAILSYPAGVPEKIYDARSPETGRKTARELNIYAKELCESAESESRFGWFACLPDLRDTEGALQELEHALDELRADGVSLSSSYGEGHDAVYLGDDKFAPVWQALNVRSAVVFVHGTQTPSSNQYPHDFLGVPIVDVPNETFKAAAHLVVTEKKRRYGAVKIILAHLGGTAMMLAPRVATLSRQMGCSLSSAEIMEDFTSFYLDSALTSHRSTIRFVEETAGLDKVLFGTDYPAVSAEVASWHTNNFEEYLGSNGDKLEDVCARNASRLFPRFANGSI